MDELFVACPTRVQIYTDGSCEPNPGPGGWAAISRFEGCEWVLMGNDPDTTNNRMELQAAVAALAVLDRLRGRCQIELYTDSQYVQQGITEWIDEWIRTGWRIKTGEAVKNQDLWQTLHQLTQAQDVTWHWLKGHADHPLNERADQLAAQARRGLQIGETSGSLSAPDVAAEHLTPVQVCIKVAGRSGAQAGAWAAVLRTGDHTRDLSGRESNTTTNALLIRAATRALEALTRPCRVTICSDAEYLIKGASQWIGGWRARGWQTKDGKPVANRAEWEALLAAAARHHVTWQIVAADAAPSDMERAAQQAADALEAGE